MRYLRSFALCAMAMCASAMMTMPASAFTPIDPGLHAIATPGVERPAPMIDNALLAVVKIEVSHAASISPGAHGATVVDTSTRSLIDASAGTGIPPVGHRMRT